MQVQMVAATSFVTPYMAVVDDPGYIPNSKYIPHAEAEGVRPPDELAEFAGRLCYQSWDRPNPATASNAGYLANIIDHQHFSVLEHASVSFYVSGVSRSLLAELTRHRHLSLSVESQRYVDQAPGGVLEYVIPPVFNEVDVSDYHELKDELAMVTYLAEQAYSFIYDLLIERGFKKKQAREAARSVLPQATTTELVVSGNLRAWREMLQMRLSPDADKEIRQLAEIILVELKEYAPNTFQDFKE